MLAIHKEQATATMMAWAKFAELGSGRHHDTHFKTEAGYIKYRMIDIGTMSVPSCLKEPRKWAVQLRLV